MVQQENQELSVVALRTAAALQGAFVNHLTAFFLQSQILIARIISTRNTLWSVYSTHHLFTRPEQKLLLQLQQVEPVLRTARLGIDLGKEPAYKRDDLR